MALRPCRELYGTFPQALTLTHVRYRSCTRHIALTPTKAHHPLQCGTVQVILQPLPNMSSKLEPGYGRGGARPAIGQELQGLQVKGAGF